MENKIDSAIEYLEIEDGTKYSFSDSEKEVALTIINNLKGISIIRATKILKFCLQAIHLARI